MGAPAMVTRGGAIAQLFLARGARRGGMLPQPSPARAGAPAAHVVPLTATNALEVAAGTVHDWNDRRTDFYSLRYTDAGKERTVGVREG